MKRKKKANIKKINIDKLLNLAAKHKKKSTHKKHESKKTHNEEKIGD